MFVYEVDDAIVHNIKVLIHEIQLDFQHEIDVYVLYDDEVHERCDEADDVDVWHVQ